LQGVLDRQGPSLFFLTRLGDMYARQGQDDKAAAAYAQAMNLAFPPGTKVRDYHCKKLAAYYENKGDAVASRRYAALGHYLAGYDAFWKEQLGAARGLLEKAVELDPTLAPAWFYLGETCRLQGQKESAREAYQRCLKIRPDDGRAIAGMALLDVSAK
jgi:tetratricopeptide (TPR) repeat protein